MSTVSASSFTIASGEITADVELLAPKSARPCQAARQATRQAARQAARQAVNRALRHRPRDKYVGRTSSNHACKPQYGHREATVMSSHPIGFQGSVIAALRGAIEQQIPHSRAAVNGVDGHFSIEVTSPAFVGKGRLERHWLVYLAIVHLLGGDASPVQAVDSLKTRTPARLEPGFVDHGWLRLSSNTEHLSRLDLIRTES